LVTPVAPATPRAVDSTVARASGEDTIPSSTTWPSIVETSTRVARSAPPVAISALIVPSIPTSLAVRWSPLPVFTGR